MVTVCADDPPEQVVKAVLEAEVTRIPLWKGKPENIIGILHAKDLLRTIQASGGDLAKIDVTVIARPPWFVPDIRPLSEQLKAFRRRKTHFALVVDEWGAWYAPLPGSTPGFLVQQNSLRDAILAALNLNIFARHADRVRMANIAQMINVLQAMIMTDKEKMVLTPTYYVFKMYVPFQDATFVPMTFDAGTYKQGAITLPRVDAIAARDTSGKLWLEITNLDPDQAVDIETSLIGITAKSAKGETLTAPKVDSVNTFDAPNTVVPKQVFAKVVDGKLNLKLEPKSVTVLSVEQ
jgi:alpha-L-arabinofuranosidase